MLEQRRQTLISAFPVEAFPQLEQLTTERLKQRRTGNNWFSCRESNKDQSSTNGRSTTERLRGGALASRLTALRQNQMGSSP